jgi:hypothetical protein
MSFSLDRQNRFAHLIFDGLYEDDLADFKDEDLAVKIAKKAVAEFFKVDEEIDQAARRKVASLKRNLPEGSMEWNIMYAKYIEEERRKRGQ